MEQTKTGKNQATGTCLSRPGKNRDVIASLMHFRFQISAHAAHLIHASQLLLANLSAGATLEHVTDGESQ
jgi:hypothetical protein